jgi:hypothetical protein
MKKPKHHFYLESTKNKDGEQRILFNFSYGYKEYNHMKNEYKLKGIKISSKWSIDKKYWIDRPIYRANRPYAVKFGKVLNNLLDKIENAAYESLNTYREENRKNPEPKELKNLIFISLEWNEKVNKDIRVSSYLENLIKKRSELPKTSPEFWGNGSVRNYNNFKNHIIKYEKKTKSILTFSGLNEDIYWEFFNGLDEIYFNETEDHYTVNSMAKECKNFKAILNCAKEDSIKIGFDHSKKKYKIHSIHSPKYEAVLKENDIKKIIKSNVSHSKELTHARNYLIIASFTGLRIGDVTKLHEVTPELINIDKVKFPIFTSKIRKSKENLIDLIATIPIPKPLKDLINSNNGKFPKFPSEQVLRRDITKFLKHLEFNESRQVTTHYYRADPKTITIQFFDDFTPHNCRSTFITNLNQLGVLEETVKPITHPSHKFKTTLSSYDKSSMTDKAIRFIKELNSKDSEIYRY